MTKALENRFLEGLNANRQKLYRICLAYAKNDADAKDLYQECLMQIWRAMPTFQQKSAIGTWMFRITLNACLRLSSKKTKRQNLFISTGIFDIHPEETTETDTDTSIRLKQLRNCIQQLNDADKAIISLYLEELPYKEISHITGILENTVAVKVKRIKTKLLNCLTQTS